MAPNLILRVAVTSSACVLAATGAISQPTTTDTVGLVGVHVVDLERGGVRRNQTIVVSAAGGRIVEIATGAATRVQPTRRVDATGKFVIPGLWDMHVHTLQPDRENYLAKFVANGVTGVRDMGTQLSNLALAGAWRREAAEGKRIGPRIYASGPALGTPKAGTGLTGWFGGRSSRSRRDVEESRCRLRQGVLAAVASGVPERRR